MKKCYVCKVSTDTRNYGTKRKFICADCAYIDPERRAIANMYIRQDLEARGKMEADFIAILEDSLEIKIQELKTCACSECQSMRKQEIAKNQERTKDAN